MDNTEPQTFMGKLYNTSKTNSANSLASSNYSGNVNKYVLKNKIIFIAISLSRILT